MKKLAAILYSAALIAVVSCIFFYGCGKKEIDAGMEDNTGGKKLVTVSGSTSVGPLMEILAEGYKGENRGVSIEIQQIGSSAGIKNAESGVSEIGMSSRDLKPDEAEKVSAVPIAYDGIAVITNKDNVLDNLTIAEIRDIYTGKIKNWSEVGGEDGKIVIVSREEGSGTRDSFQEIAGFTAGELAPKALIGDGNGSIKTTVIGNRNAIGYISFEYLDEEVKGLRCEGISPDSKNVLDGSYILYRPFIAVYREGSISREAESFLSYILSSEGQKLVGEYGNIRVR